MPTRYGRSPWIDQFPKSRVPTYPKHRGPLKVDVVVIGGGLTGCATAYAFAAAGIKVALFEAGRLGQGASGFSTGWLAEEPGVGFADLEKTAGLRAARHGFQAWRRAALDFAALVKRLDIKCHLTPSGLLTAALTAEQAGRLKREQKVRKAAGLDASIVNTRASADESAIASLAALRSRDGAVIDPYRAAIGLAAAAAARKAKIFENTAVRKTTFTRKYADVVTDAGRVRVSRIIVATGLPTTLFGSLRRHFWFRSAYLALTERVPARTRQQLGKRAVVVRDLAAPPHTVRWVDDERLLVSGADGPVVPARRREQTMVQRTGQLMYELSTIYPDISGILPAYGWESSYAATAEGLPYIGPHRNFPFHLFAFGDSSHSVTGAYLASRVLLRHHLDDLDASDSAFSFTR
jgi:glycine/D-amino acid oxidase-like deaminating enzyme